MCDRRGRSITCVEIGMHHKVETNNAIGTGTGNAAATGGVALRAPQRRHRVQRCSRRAVLAGAARCISAGAFATPAVISRAAWARAEAAPNERIRLGFIGIGMMGQGHLKLFLGQPDVQVVAVCDVDQWRREYALKVVARAYADRQRSGEWRGCKAYRDLRDLLDRTDLDAVVIATGDRWHPTASVLVAAAGKDIYCEKPVATTVREAAAIVQAVKRYGRVFQTGLQQRSEPQFQAACKLVQEGRIGTLQRIYVPFPGTSVEVNLPPEPVPEGLDWNLWLGPCPWRPFNSRYHHYGRPKRVVPWDFCRDFAGGSLTSNAVHALDVVQWALKADGSGPVEIEPPEAGQVPSLTYRYRTGITVQVTWQLEPGKHQIPPGWDPATRLQNFGALFVGDRGWIHVGRRGFLQSHPPDITANWQKELEAFGPVIDHHRNWLNCIRSRGKPACDAVAGAGSTVVALLGCIAHWTGRKLHWDPAAMRFVGDEAANRLLARAMREPWQI